MVAGAVALIFAPTAAMADPSSDSTYGAPGYGSTVTDTTPVVGSPFTYTVNGVAPGAAVTLKTCDGQTLTATADASGAASFSVALGSAGSCTAQAFIGGTLVSDQVLTVAAAPGAAAVAAEPVAAVVGAAPAAAAVRAPRAAAPAALGLTGFDGVGLAVGAGALVLAGAGTVYVVKRRKSANASI